MTNSEMLSSLQKIGAIIQNSHIVYTSGRHGSAYVNKDALYPHTQLTSELCKQIAVKIQPWKPEVVLAPALGGIILSQWVAFHLTELGKKEILGIYAEKDPASEMFVLKRGYDKLIKDKRVVILEDILTTGGSVRKVVAAIRDKSTIVGVAAICNRGDVTKKVLGDVPELTSLLNISLDSWEAKECPLCKKEIPINTDVGKGREFLALWSQQKQI